MAARGAIILLLLGLCVVGYCLSPTMVLSTEEQEKIKDQLYSRNIPGEDLLSTYYTIASLKLLNADVGMHETICKFVNKEVDSTNVASIFYATSISKLLGDCQVKLENAQSVLTVAINEKSDTETIRFAVEALANLGQNLVDANVITEALKSILKSESEEFVPSATNAMFVATHLTGNASFAFDLIEDAVAQADEIGDTFIQFEGGLKLNGDFITGVYKLAEHVKKAPVITEDQVMKFANYLLSRKFVQSAEDTFFLLSSLTTLSNNQFHVPVFTQLSGSSAISQNNKIVKVRVTNAVDKLFAKMTVTADTIVGKDYEELANAKSFTEQKDFYQLDVMSFNPSAGFYKIDLSIKPEKPDKRLVGLTGAQLSFKVVTKISIEDVGVSVIDKEHSSLVNSVSVNHPKSLDKVLEADHHQKVTMTFSLKDQLSGELTIAHQTFIRLMNTQTSQEIFFVAEPEPSKIYKFDLDVGTAAKESFGSLSGKYQMDLLIGDAAIENSLSWTIGSLQLSFADSPAQTKQEKGGQFKRKPTIEHMFRQPEKRPPKAVSSAFTILVLLPLLILLIGWLKLGVNFSNFQFSIAAIVFHVGLGAIFALMYAFWTCLNMFSTLKLLAFIGTVTFLGGNSLLANLASQRIKN